MMSILCIFFGNAAVLMSKIKLRKRRALLRNALWYIEKALHTHCVKCSSILCDFVVKKRKCFIVKAYFAICFLPFWMYTPLKLSFTFMPSRLYLGALASSVSTDAELMPVGSFSK